MYKEDVDLAWRLRRRGWRAWYEPAALAWHARGTGGRPERGVMDIVRSDREIPRRVKAMSWRNQRLMQLKNERVSEFVRDLPWIAAREVAATAYVAAFDRRRLGQWSPLARLAPLAIAKRRSSPADERPE
jgi:GT2 family glycosyltransferase